MFWLTIRCIYVYPFSCPIRNLLNVNNVSVIFSVHYSIKRYNAKNSVLPITWCVFSFKKLFTSDSTDIVYKLKVSSLIIVLWLYINIVCCQFKEQDTLTSKLYFLLHFLTLLNKIHIWYMHKWMYQFFILLSFYIFCANEKGFGWLTCMTLTAQACIYRKERKIQSVILVLNVTVKMCCSLSNYFPFICCVPKNTVSVN